MNWILTGYRGTGKTSVGRLLAAKRAVPFFDSDEMIEAAAGKTIRALVAEKGWDFFRREERRVVAELSAKDNCILALGGGAVLDGENVRKLRGRGFWVWLTADAQTIAGRLQGDAGTGERRPSLTGKNPKAEIRYLLKEREPAYAGIADCRVDTSGRSVAEVAAEVVRILDEMAEENPGKGK
jgi:shikimate kinase